MNRLLPLALLLACSDGDGVDARPVEDVGVSPDGSAADAAQEADAAPNCDLPRTAMQGQPCGAGCDEGGECADFDGDALCTQACIPGECPSVCGDGFLCAELTENGAPAIREDGRPAGGCVPGTADRASYEACGPGVACAAGHDCLVGGSPTGFCAPGCAEDGSCPARDGIAARCILTKDGGEPTHCALVCQDIEGSTDCPGGMGCWDVGSVGICAFEALPE